MDIRNIDIPIKAGDFDGPFTQARAELIGFRGENGLAEIVEIDPKAGSWLEEFDTAFVQIRDDGSLLAVREPTNEDYHNFRVPIWIQDPEIPECCGKPMFFVGELADNRLCAEAPDDAKVWWHDTACFYIFTCGECLDVKAVGQQY